MILKQTIMTSIVDMMITISGVGGPVLGIPKLTFWVSGQYTTQDKYSVYEFDNKEYIRE